MNRPATVPARRGAEVSRTTNETDVAVELVLDGAGASRIATGLGFLDHMLTALARHARIDLALSCTGDLHVDDHHTVEDCALALGQAIDAALGERRAIARFGSACAPLDEALARAVVDCSGRAFASVELAFTREMLGDTATENITHFFASLAGASRTTMHIDLIRGENDHHKAEAAFKAFALALREAVAIDPAADSIPSTKGTLSVSGPEVTIIETGIANIASVAAAFARVGCDVVRTDSPAGVKDASLLVLPGVGSFGAGMARLRDRGLVEALRRRSEDGLPLLGICLGMQLLFEASEESPGVSGLSVVPGRITRFGTSVRVPQFGWNRVETSPMCRQIDRGYAYFANSFCAIDPPEGWACATADHGGPFVCAMERGSVLACQFHPELSGPWGLSLLGRWLRSAEGVVPC